MKNRKNKELIIRKDDIDKKESVTIKYKTIVKFVGIFILGMLTYILGSHFYNNSSPEKYINSLGISVNNIVYSDKLEDGKNILFFEDNDSNINSIILEKKTLGYRVFYLGGRLSKDLEHYRLTSFEREGKKYSLYFGVLDEKNTKIPEGAKVVEVKDSKLKLAFLLLDGEKSPKDLGLSNN